MLPSDKYPIWVELLAAATITVLVGLLVLVAPLFLGAVLLMPLPLVYLIVRRNLNQGLLALALASLFLYLVLGNVSLLLLLLLYCGPPGIIIGLLIKNRASVEHSVYVLFSWALLAAGLNLACVSINGASGLSDTAGEINSIMEQMSKQYLAVGAIDEAEQQQFMQIAHRMSYLAQLFLPGSVIVWTTMITLGTYFITRRLLPTLGLAVPGGMGFSRWCLPWYSIWLVISGLALTLAGEEFTLTLPGVVGKNILFVSGFIFFMLGLAVITYYFQTWKTARMVKIIVAVLIFLYIPFVILALGVVDPVANLRRFPGNGGEGTKGG